MEKYDILEKLINKLIYILNSYDGKLFYNKKVQEKAGIWLKEIATLSKTFDANIKNERKNIKNDLVVTDKTTGEKTDLIDIDYMAERVRNILEKNNVFSCLKMLALSNKCAHIFDGDIEKIRTRVEKYYKLTYSPKKRDKINFMEFPELIFPPMNSSMHNIEGIDDYQFDKMTDVLFGNDEVKKGTKISILNSLNIKFDNNNIDDINQKFNSAIEKRKSISYIYLLQQYKKGQQILDLQSKMFAIKDTYIVMIGQLLKNDADFRNIKYELIKTTDAIPGFENMLILDDKDLSYYIEVHMPDFIAFSLIKQHGFETKKERETQKLGASAVYVRDELEIKKILDAMRNNLIESSQRQRTEIITRGHSITTGEFPGELSSENIEQEQREPTGSEDYFFVADEITSSVSLIEKFTVLNKINLDGIKFNKYIQVNERFPKTLSRNIAYKNYYNIYNKFNDNVKEKFIDYSFNELKNGDVFDKITLEQIYAKGYDDDYDLVGKVVINNNRLKEEFIEKISHRSYSFINKYEVKEFNDMIRDNIDNYMDFEKNKGMDKNERKR